MKLEVIENEDEKLKIRIPDATLITLVNENVWQQKGIDVSAYAPEHTYLSQPVLLVRAKNPKKAVLDAIGQIQDDVKDLKKQFNAQVK